MNSASANRISAIGATLLSFQPKKITYENKEYILFGNTEQLMVVDVEKALHQYDKTKLILTDLEINHQKIQVGDTINNR